jgi:hypothetical protein
MATREVLDLSRLRPEDLAGLDDDQWKQVIDADLRRGAARPPDLPSSIPPALRSARNIDRFYASLTMIATSLEGQLVMREDDYESDQARLRADIMSAEFALEEARRNRYPNISQLTRQVMELRVRSEDLKSQYLRKRAGTMRFKSAVEETLAECDALRNQLVTTFRVAIARHREIMKEEGIEPSSLDEELWKTLDI